MKSNERDERFHEKERSSLIKNSYYHYLILEIRSFI